MAEFELKEQIRNEIKDCRFHADCMSLLVKKFRNYDKILNVFLALTSSGSIASWAIWDRYSMVWATLIACSQLVNALKPLFPFHKHVHTLNSRCYKQELLFLELIEMWQNLNDKFDEGDQIKTHLSYIKKQINENEFFDDDDGFEFSKKIINKAEKMTADILNTKYKIQ